ncbi:MAG: DUF4258 domain-containing protein [Proteobacteria bacterium]|nr:DUF4258 domain-containing protein [Pseudomonadota bacterium]
MVKFDRHARRRMKWRKISEAEVMTTLENPERTEDTLKGKKNAYRLIGDRFLKVTYKLEPHGILVISAVVKD